MNGALAISLAISITGLAVIMQLIAINLALQRIARAVEVSHD